MKKLDMTSILIDDAVRWVRSHEDIIVWVPCNSSDQKLDFSKQFSDKLENGGARVTGQNSYSLYTEDNVGIFFVDMDDPPKAMGTFSMVILVPDIIHESSRPVVEAWVRVARRDGALVIPSPPKGFACKWSDYMGVLDAR